jgi:site-specific DNA recombinase
MEQALGYIRVSTDKQDFERQRSEIIQYAKKNNFQVVKVFEDKQSGSDYDDRRGFQDLLIYLDDNPLIKIIIFDEISRMGRDTAMQVTTYKALTKKGIRVFTRGKGEFGSNKEDNLLFTVLSAIADYEKQTIIDRTSSGRRKVVRDGFTQLSQRPFGYNILFTKKKDRDVQKRQYIEINEEEAAAVKKMYEIIDNNGSVFDVLRYLKKNHIKPPKSKEWAKSSVLRMLHSTTFYGEWRFGKYVRDNRTKHSLVKRKEEDLIIVKVPPIISKNLFENVQRKLSYNQIKFNPTNQKQDFLLKGLFKCSCSRLMQCISESRSNARIYRCPERNIRELSKKTCPVKSLKADFVEKILLQELKEKIEDKNFLQDIKLQKLEKYASPVKALEKRRVAIWKEYETNNENLKNSYEKSLNFFTTNPEKAKVFENLADDLLRRIKIQKAELDSLDKEITETKEQSIDYSLFNNIRKGLEFIKQKDLEEFDSGFEKKLEFMRTYIKEIRLRYLNKDTEKVRQNILQLRNGIYKKDSEGNRAVYRTVANKYHDIRNTAMQMIMLEVDFVNNYTMQIKLPYFHEKPDILRSYLKDNSASIIKKI